MITSVFADIPLQISRSAESLFFKTNNPEVDALTILCMQLVLRNHLIFERQSTMYLAEGEFSGHDKEKEHV